MRCKHTRAPENATFCPDCGVRLVSLRGEKRIPVPKQRGECFGAQVTIDGERVYISGKTEADYYSRVAAARAGLLEIKKAPPKESLGSVIDKYLRDHKNVISPSTYNNYLSYRKTRFPNYMDKNIHTLPWQEMLNEEAEKYSPKTVTNAWSLVSLSLEYAKVEKPQVKLPKKRKAERKWLDYQQIETFLEAIHGKPYEVGALLALHGLRRSELLHLSADDIDITRGLIHIRGASVVGEKNKLVDKDDNKNATSTRIVHVVIPRLTELVEGMDGRLVTTNPTTLYGSINYQCKKHGLPEVGVHGLRHSFISLCFHLNWDMQTVMREGGYANPQIVNEVYRHLASQDADADVKRMVEFYAKKVQKPITT